MGNSSLEGQTYDTIYTIGNAGGSEEVSLLKYYIANPSEVDHTKGNAGPAVWVGKTGY